MAVKSQYSSAFAGRPYLFREMRVVAQMIELGMDKKEIIQRCLEENPFQYKTTGHIRENTNACIRYLAALGDERLVHLVATGAADDAKQISLYAMMCAEKIIWDLMVTVVGEKYRVLDYSLSKLDIKEFIMRLKTQVPEVAAWTDKTEAKVVQSLMKILIENDYIDGYYATKLKPVLLGLDLEDFIRRTGKTAALAAFGCIA